MPEAPLFGLRWVPDSQLRPLRYLPNPQASPAASLASTATGADGSEWWLRAGASAAAARGGSPARARAATTPSEAESAAASSAARQLHQNVRMLQQRLSEAHESVRQKVEQIRWLKEMTKDDASRSRVARWMRGPLLRVFSAWRKCVRDAQRRALDDLQTEQLLQTARQKHLQARCDDLAREHAVLQVALEHFFRHARARRAAKQVRACWRRWAPLRRHVGISSGGAGAPGSLRTQRGGGGGGSGGGSGGRGLLFGGGWRHPPQPRLAPLASVTARRSRAFRALAADGRAVALGQAFACWHARARRQGRTSTIAARARRRHDARSLRRAVRAMGSLLVAAALGARATGPAAATVRSRAALRRLRRACGRRSHLRSLLLVLAPHNQRRGLRLAWCRWAAEVLRKLSAQRKVEATRAQEATRELEAQVARLGEAEEEVGCCSATLDPSPCPSPSPLCLRP